MKKKILWILLLIIALAGIIYVLVFVKPKEKEEIVDSGEVNFNRSAEQETSVNEKQEYKRIELDDGILYAVNGEQLNPDLVIGDNYFDTTLSDMFLNPEDYYGMKIEIEGMFLTDGKYTSVGRYSTSSLCQFCPPGYSFIEYQLVGDIEEELKAEQDWIKIVGTLEKANDETSNYLDYFYIKANNIEIMNEKGNDTVNN